MVAMFLAQTTAGLTGLATNLLAQLVALLHNAGGVTER